MKYKPIQLDEELHARGEREQLSPEEVRALAWDVAAVLIRRHPGRLWVVEAHPAPTYDCLSILDVPPRAAEPSFLVHLNLEGHLTTMYDARMADPERRFNWFEVLHAPDRTEYVIKQLEGATGLRRLSSNPQLSRRSIGPAVLACLAAESCSGPVTWALRAGFGFDSDFEPFRVELFEQFPQLPTWELRNGDLPAACRFWFVLTPGDVPVLAIDTERGIAHQLHGGSIQLHDAYLAERRDLTSVIDSALRR